MQVCFHLWPQVTAQYLVFTARHGGQRALEPDSIHLVVQQENRLTKAVFGAEVAAHHGCPAAQQHGGDSVQVKAGFHRGREQMLCVLAPLSVHNVAHRIADRAGLTCQHIFDLGICQGQPGFAPHLFPNVIHAANHAEFQTVRSVSRRDGVVDAHEVHRPAAKIHEEH